MNGKVAFHFALASQAPVFFYLLASEVTLFRVENFTTAFYYLALALSATTLTTTSGGKIDTFVGKCGEEVASLLHVEFVLVVNRNRYLAAGRKIFLCHKQDNNQEEYHYQEYSDAC